jgi:hypothetical protein
MNIRTYWMASALTVACIAKFSLAAEPKSGDWPMFGGNPSRNFVNLQEKNIPGSWDLDSQENIKWAVDLGSEVESMWAPTIRIPEIPRLLATKGCSCVSMKPAAISNGN